MQGSRHLPSPFEALNYENDLNKHHKKLIEIHRGNSKKRNMEDEAKTKMVGLRDRYMKYHQNERALTIEKENELLLGKLVEIARKKKSIIPPPNEFVSHQKSLNAALRKKEKERIAMENEALARRLLSQQPNLNRKKLDQDFEKHTERVKLLQKLVKLPPIRYDGYGVRKSQSSKDKREKDITKKKRKKSQPENLEEEEERKEREFEKMKEEYERKEREEMEREEQLRKEQEERERERKEREEKERKLKEERERIEKEEAERKARELQEQREREREEKERLEAERMKAEEENKKAKKGDSSGFMMGMLKGVTKKK